MRATPPPPPPQSDHEPQTHAGGTATHHQRSNEAEVDTNNGPDLAIETQLLGIFRLQERTLGPDDPLTIATKNRLDAIVKARQDSMTLDQRMKSSTDRLNHKKKLLDTAKEKVIKAQAVVESAQMQVLVEQDKVAAMQQEYEKHSLEHAKILDEMKQQHAADTSHNTQLGAQQPTSSTSAPPVSEASTETLGGLAALGISVPTRAPEALKNQAHAIAVAIKELNEAIQRIAKQEQKDIDVTFEPNNTAAETATSSRSNKKKTDTVSISADAPAPKRSNANVVSVEASQSLDMESCP